MNCRVLYITTLVLTLKECLSNQCVFPDYLQSAIKNNVLKPWKTRTWWVNLRADPKWKESEDIYVRGSSMWHERELNPITCEKKSRRVSNKIPSFDNCSQRSVLYNRTCLGQEYNKYRILQKTNGKPNKYICLMFLRRSENVVQVLKGPTRERNVPDLCSEHQMYMDEWLWIATWKVPTAVCPLNGGFTFRTISRLTNQDLCEDDWRNSRLEIECLHGDGLNFISPKGSHCNPFSSKSELSVLHCWAGWEQNDYIFMIASTANSLQPQYCLRFPKNIYGNFTVYVYFSVICQMQEDGKPPPGIDYYQLRMSRDEPGTCKDENEKICHRHAEKGMCEKSNHKFIHHCKKTCNLCENVEELVSLKCPFDDVLHGTWILYDRDRQESLSINNTVLMFSKSGSFICHRRTREESEYRVISIFQNGCSTRYSCIELTRRNRNILQYRLGRSDRQNLNNEDMCVFRDEPFPLLDSYRSSSMKNIVLANTRDLWYSFCGLQGEFPFYGLFKGENCTGTISDWDEHLCKPHGQLTLQTNNCNTLRSRKFQCLLYLEDEIGMFDELLITRSLDDDEFNCWVITRYLDAGHEWKNRVIHQMPNPQCSAFTELLVHVDRPPKSSLYLNDDRKSKRCITPPPTTININVNSDIFTTPYSGGDYYVNNPGHVDSTVILQEKPLPYQPRNTAYLNCCDFKRILILSFIFYIL